MNNQAGDDSYLCGLCEMIIKCVKRQLKIQTWENPWPGAMFGKRFICRKHQNKHMQSLAGENHYHRALCGNILISWNHIMRHMKIHPRKNQYQCDLCGKRLISRSKTNSHMKCHAREIQISGLCLARQLYPRTTISISLCSVWQNNSRNHTKRHMQKSF